MSNSAFGAASGPSRPSIATARSFTRTSQSGSGGGGASLGGSAAKRARSSSLVSVQEIPVNYDDTLDQGSLYNVNANWVNFKAYLAGMCLCQVFVMPSAWMIHVVLIFIGILVLDMIPGITSDVTWTIANLSYLFITYIVFHYVTGVPFDLSNNSGVYDHLTLWEQIDSGAQYTPAKKWLTTLPIALFLASTHYTRFDSHPALFTLNLVTLLVAGLAPKLPYFHRIRIKFFDTVLTPEPSGPPTPVEGVPPTMKR